MAGQHTRRLGTGVAYVRAWFGRLSRFWRVAIVCVAVLLVVYLVGVVLLGRGSEAKPLGQNELFKGVTTTSK